MISEISACLMAKNINDSGRYAVTHNPADIGKFKVPGLRNVAITAPYMHDGSLKTLREVIDYYDQPKLLVPERNRQRQRAAATS